MINTFNTLLENEGISIKDVRLLRHKDTRTPDGVPLYDLWIKQRDKFEFYISYQHINSQKKLYSPYWANFIGTPDKKTLFVGLYHAQHPTLIRQDEMMPTGLKIHANEYHRYQLVLEDKLKPYIGDLYVEWGEGYRAWIQNPTRQNKDIAPKHLNS